MFVSIFFWFFPSHPVIFLLLFLSLSYLALLSSLRAFVPSSSSSSSFPSPLPFLLFWVTPPPQTVDPSTGKVTEWKGKKCIRICFRVPIRENVKIPTRNP